MVKKNICMYTNLSVEECLLNIKKITCKDNMGSNIFATNEMIFIGDINDKKFIIKRRTAKDNFPVVVFNGMLREENEYTKIEGTFTNQYFPNMNFVFKLLLTIIGIFIWFAFIYSGLGAFKVIAILYIILINLKFFFFINKRDVNYIIENLKKILEIDNER